MPPVVRVGMRCLLTLMVGIASFAFGTGVVKAQIDNRLDRHADSIYVSAVKYEELEQRCVELQAVYYEHTSRIAILEEQFARSGDILEALYEHQTGQEWVQR